jgi:hypothetical protein
MQIIEALPARYWWDTGYLQKYSSESVFVDTRAGAPASHAWWQGDDGEVGAFIHGYESTWLPRALLRDGSRERLAEALVGASRFWSVALHFNKGLAGSPADAVAAAAATATNPAALDAFALAIVAGSARPSYSNGYVCDPDLARASDNAEQIHRAMAELRNLVARPGTYLAESNYFEQSWQQGFFGENYARLKAIKDTYDPTGLFFVRHGVGSELWSDDGFTYFA